MFNLFNKKCKIIEKDELELRQIAAKELTLVKNQFMYFENRKNNEILNQYFDYYIEEKEFLSKILEILTDKKLLIGLAKDEDGEYSFEKCVRELVKKRYMVDYNGHNGKDLFDVLNSTFNLKISENDFYERLRKKYDKYDNATELVKDELQIIEMCKLLKERNLGIIHFYSIGDFYCYGVFNIDKIKKIKSLFETLL